MKRIITISIRKQCGSKRITLSKNFTVQQTLKQQCNTVALAKTNNYIRENDILVKKYTKQIL